MINKRKTKRSPFNSLFEYNVPNEDIQKQNRQFEIMKELGISNPSFGSSTENYNNDEITALEYIYRDMEVPEDLRQRLLERKKNKEINVNKTLLASDKLINDIIGEE